MDSLLLYVVFLTLGISLFTLGYKWLMHNSTNYLINRAYILSAILIAIVSPLFPLNLGINSIIANSSAFKNTQVLSLEVSEITAVSSDMPTEIYSLPFDLMSIIKILLITVTLIFLIRYLFRIASLLKLLLTEPRVIDETGVELIYSEKTSNAFSFFGNIFINPNKFNYEEKRLIIEHEKVHIRHFHSIDLIIIELLVVVQWFNPFVYILRRSLVENHELIADQGVISKGNDPYSYQNLLLNVISSKVLPYAGNQFSAFITKKRLAMIGNMNKQTKSKIYLLSVIPVSLILIILVSAFTPRIDDTKIDSQQTTQDTVKTKKIAKQTEEEVFQVVEQYPTFGSGDPNEFRDYIFKNLKYPKEASEKGIVGRVYIQFIVEKDGQLSGFKVLKSANPLLDEEALRVIKSSPKWNPGMQKGKPVRVAFTFPINFALDGKDNKKDIKSDDLFTVVEEMPKFGENDMAFRKFIADNLKYPEEAAKQNVKGTVYVQFTITKEGDLVNPKVLRGVHKLLDDEAVRVVMLSPKWTPGKQRGQNVNVQYTMPIIFALGENKK